MRISHKNASRAAKVASRKPAEGDASDPLFNQSVQKALAILEAFGNEKSALNLTEIGVAVGMTKSSAQRCTHTLERLGYLRRDPSVKRWVLTPRALEIAHSYLSGYGLLEQATPHLVDLNQACGESVSLSEPHGTDMVYIARFPSHKRFFIHMPVGRRLPMYCSGAGRAYLSLLPRKEAQRILRQSTLHAYTPYTLTDPKQILREIDAAREAGYAWTAQEFYRGDLTIAAPVPAPDGEPVAAINISAPTSRWTLDELRAKLSSLLLETARAASSGIATIPRGS
ncbi:MAG TPA: IclR family transcriptional regulator [Steroidobacteraceae bacterium]|nr:IclR family transcriptional regulator [Steroidobacteraceae bacterium]